MPFEAALAGFKLGELVRTKGARAEEAKLKAQLYKGQADKEQAEAALITNKVQRMQQYQQGLAEELTGFGGGGQGQQGPPGGLQESITRNPEAPQLTSPLTQQPVATQALAPPPAQPEALGPPMDTYARLQEVLSARALKAGLFDEYAKIQQGLLEYQKVKTAQRQEQLQNELGDVQKARSVERDPERLALLRFKEAQVLGQLGKTNDMQAALERKLTVVPQGATVLESQTGQGPREVYQNQGAGGLDKDQARLNVDLYGSRTPPPGFPQATRDAITYKQEQERLNAGLGRPQGTPAAPGAGPRRAQSRPDTPTSPAAVETPAAGTSRFTTTLDGQALVVDAVSEAAAQQFLQGQFPGRTFVVTPEAQTAPTLGPRAQQAQQTERARLTEQGLTPGDPTRPVTGQREAAQLREQGLVPGDPTNPVAGQRAAATTGGENLDADTRTQLGALQKSQRLLRDIKSVPKAKQEEYVGILRRPQAQLDTLVNDLSKSGSGDRVLYRLLADLADLQYTLSRPDVGANYTAIEKETAADIYPSARDTTATAYFAKLERLGPLLESKIAEVTRNATITRKELKEQQGSPAQPAAQGQETPEQIEERIRKQMKLPARTK